MLPNEDDLEFLRRLTAAAGPSGFETPVQRVWVEQVRDAATNVQSDAYGNVWA